MRDWPIALVLRSIGTRALTVGLAFATSVLVARYYGAGGLAAYATGAAYGAFALLAADLGLNTAALRWFVLDGPQADLFKRLSRVKTALVLFACPVAFAILVVVSGFRDGLLLAAGSVLVATTIATLTGPSVAVLRACGQMDKELVRFGLERIASTGLAVLCAVLGAPLWLVGAALIGTNTALVYSLRRASSALLVSGVTAPIRRLSGGLPYAGALAFETVAFRFDSVLLPRYEDAAGVGAYAAAYRFIFLVAGASAAVQAVLLPRWVSTHGRGSRGRVTAIGFIGAAAVGLVISISSSLLPLVYGVEFNTAVPLLQTLATSACLVPMYFVVSTALIADGHTHVFLAGWAVAGTFNFVSNLIVLPAMGAQGAALTTVLTDGLLLTVWIVGAVAVKSLPRWSAVLAAALAAPLGALSVVR